MQLLLLLTLMTLLRIPYLGRIGSTKLVLPKWHKYGILNKVIRVRILLYCRYTIKTKLKEQTNERFGPGTIAKGQLISKCPFGVFKSPKKPIEFFPGFLP